MKKINYPTGVECHGGCLRVWFMYEGKRCRESLSIPDTPKNRKAASELRQSVMYAIKTGTFNYANQFPASSRVAVDTERREITVKELFEKWLTLKGPDIADNSMRRYKTKLQSSLAILGSEKLVNQILPEDLSALRNELLNGQQMPNKFKLVAEVGRAVSTVNDYMSAVNAAFKFAHDNGYAPRLSAAPVKPLKKSKRKPDPLLPEEFMRVIDSCINAQGRNLWTVAVYTGMRHGEICALAWEDVDLVRGTIMVRRNATTVKQFTVPKTEASTDRVIQLVAPAIEALKNQAALTRLNKQHRIQVHLREKRVTREDICTFVFSPKISNRNGLGGEHFHSDSLRAIWNSALKKAGLRHRKAYQSRHTFACWLLSKGANPSFIASQLGHSSAQMVYQVYGDWMPENNEEQVAMLNRKISENAPPLPHGIAV